VGDDDGSRLPSTFPLLLDDDDDCWRANRNVFGTVLAALVRLDDDDANRPVLCRCHR
jgi:hypothetical protein